MKKLIGFLAVAVSLQAHGLQNINNSGNSNTIYMTGKQGGWAQLICPNKDYPTALMARISDDVLDGAAELANVQISASSYQLTISGADKKIVLTVPMASGCALISSK